MGHSRQVFYYLHLVRQEEVAAGEKRDCSVSHKISPVDTIWGDSRHLETTGRFSDRKTELERLQLGWCF